MRLVIHADMREAVVVALLLGLGSVAHAQPGLAPAGPTTDTRESKDPATAVALSLGTTLGGVALVASGSDAGVMLGLGAMYIGPSTGQWYSGKIGTIGLVVRAVSVAAVLQGIQLLEAEIGYDCLGQEDDPECAAGMESAHRRADYGPIFIYAGLGAWAASTIVDIVLAHRAAKQWNERNVTVTPTLVNGGAGLAFDMRF
jgi:hypothetical protein